MGSKKKRVGYVDVARGIAMICIVLGHLKVNNIDRVVYTFHLPIFFLISGYFISEKGTLSEFIKKKFRTLIVPYILTCFVMILIAGGLGLYAGGIAGAGKAMGEWGIATLCGSGTEYTKPFYIRTVGALWFLWASFWGYILLRITLKFKGGQRTLFVAVVFLLSYFSCKFFWLPLCIQRGGFALLFMYIGYLYKQEKETVSSLSKETKFFILFAAALLWINFIKDFQGFWLVIFYFGRGMVDVFASLGASLCFLELSKATEHFLPSISSSIEFLGKNSLIMLSIHNVEYHFFPWHMCFEKLTMIGLPGNWELGFLIAGKLVLDILLTFLLANCNFIRKAYGMKRI